MKHSEQDSVFRFSTKKRRGGYRRLSCHRGELLQLGTTSHIARLSGQVGVLFYNVNADVMPTMSYCRNGRCPAADKTIQNYFSRVGHKPDTSGWQFKREFGLMVDRKSVV